MKYYIVFAFVVGLLCSCTAREQQVKNEIMVDISNIDHIFPLSKLYNNCEIIPLGYSDNTTIGQVDNLIHFDEKYYLGDGRTGTVFVFDEKGNRLSCIGRMGRGPAEYVGFMDFTIGPDSIVYILSNSPHKINRYRLDGTFMDHFEVPLSTNLAVDDNFIYLYGNSRHQRGEREQSAQLYILDKHGKTVDRLLYLDEVKSYPNPMKFNQSRPFANTDGGILFSMLLDETIYLLNDGSAAAPAYKMNYGTHTIPDSQFAVNNEDPTDLSLLLSEGIYAHDLHYVHRINGDLFFNIIIDDSYYRLMSTAGELHTVVDDILGIDSFVFEMNAKEYIGVMDTAAILFMLEYGESTPFKKKLDSTGLSIDENSNPLMIRYWN